MIEWDVLALGVGGFLGTLSFGLWPIFRTKRDHTPAPQPVVVRMLKRLSKERGTTTVIVTHDNRILELADRIVTLEEGRVVADTAVNSSARRA